MNAPAGRASPGDEPTAAQLIDLERAQIGHDLHDALLPLIFAASANLQPLLGSPPLAETDDATNSGVPVDDAVRTRIAESHQWLQQAMDVGRGLLTQIYPPELDQLPWLAAAKDTANRICDERCEITWTVHSATPILGSDWDRDVATTAYRVLVESLRNAVGHGKADSIAIRCEPNALVIVDDGQGFDPTAVPSDRFGIRSMKGRARLVGSNVTVDSAPGGPTTVRLEFC